MVAACLNDDVRVEGMPLPYGYKLLNRVAAAAVDDVVLMVL